MRPGSPPNTPPRPVPEALADAVEDAVVIDGSHHAAKPHAATVAAGPARVLDKAVLLDRRSGYSCSIASTGRFEVLVMWTCTPSLPSLDNPSAHAATEGFEVQIAVAAAGGRCRRRQRWCLAPFAAPMTRSGSASRNAPSTHVDDALARMRARRDGRRESGVQQRVRLHAGLPDRPGTPLGCWAPRDPASP